MMRMPVNLRHESILIFAFFFLQSRRSHLRCFNVAWGCFLLICWRIALFTGHYGQIILGRYLVCIDSSTPSRGCFERFTLSSSPHIRSINHGGIQNLRNILLLISQLTRTCLMLLLMLILMSCSVLNEVGKLFLDTVHAHPQIFHLLDHHATVLALPQKVRFFRNLQLRRTVVTDST